MNSKFFYYLLIFILSALIANIILYFWSDKNELLHNLIASIGGGIGAMIGFYIAMRKIKPTNSNKNT
jgi:membrane associated rhomboid family serine protease